LQDQTNATVIADITKHGPETINLVKEEQFNEYHDYNGLVPETAFFLFVNTLAEMNRIFLTSIRPCGLSPVIRPRFSAIAQPAMMVSPGLRFMSGRPERNVFETRALELLRGFEKIDSQKVGFASMLMLIVIIILAEFGCAF
jgi:hypothetical protein